MPDPTRAELVERIDATLRIREIPGAELRDFVDPAIDLLRDLRAHLTAPAAQPSPVVVDMRKLQETLDAVLPVKLREALFDLGREVGDLASQACRDGVAQVFATLAPSVPARAESAPAGLDAVREEVEAMRRERTELSWRVLDAVLAIIDRHRAAGDPADEQGA